MAKDPFVLFAKWFREAVQKVSDEPNAMALATASKSGKPSVRMVLLKSFDKSGFRFFTNYGSRKAAELKKNPQASLCFYWAPLNLQVRIEGAVKKVPRSESEAYFATRPRGSQIAASISKQSQPLRAFEDLAVAYEDFETAHPKGAIKKPAQWGGYCLVPNQFEFWSGKPSRLHERLVFRKTRGTWVASRLYP